MSFDRVAPWGGGGGGGKSNGERGMGPKICKFARSVDFG